MYYCGGNSRRNAVGFICSKRINKCVLGYNPVSDRIISLRLQGKPINITIIMVYAPTAEADVEMMEDFYDKVQETIDCAPNGDRLLYILGDWNAKVGKEKIQSVTGGFGIGNRNERGVHLIDFCCFNNLAIMNTFFSVHARRLYTWISPDRRTRNQIDFIICKNRWKSSVLRVCTFPGADCGSDHNLLAADIRLKLKTIKRPPQSQKYDVENIGSEYNL